MHVLLLTKWVRTSLNPVPLESVSLADETTVRLRPKDRKRNAKNDKRLARQHVYTTCRKTGVEPVINQTLSLSMRVRKLSFIATALALVCISGFSKAADIPSDLMVDLDSMTVPKSEFVCLALNDYFEARGEPLAGRLAVAKVVLNRAMDPRFPKNICSVIKQNKTRTAHRCQFSWYCDDRPDTPYNRTAWRRSLKLAAAVLIKDSSIADPTGGALWYHAAFVHPKWADNLEVSGIVGGHIFYRDLELVRSSRRQERRDPMIPALHRFAEWVDEQQSKPTAVASR